MSYTGYYIHLFYKGMCFDLHSLQIINAHDTWNEAYKLKGIWNYCLVNDVSCVIFIYLLGERNLPLACERVLEKHAGYELEYWEDQGGRSHVPTTREWKTEKALRISGNSFPPF